MVTDAFEWRLEVGLDGTLSLPFLQGPALSGAERASSDAADAIFVRSAQTPLRMRSCGGFLLRA